MTSKHKEFDTIVVGTGPGGATVARELAKRNKKVLILERGPNPEIKGTSLQALRLLRTIKTDNKAAVTRGFTTGGSTMFYYATAFDPPFEMLKKHGVDIEAEVEEIKHELPYAPLADDLIGPMAKRIMESAQGLGYDWQKLPKLVFQDKCKADCWRCTYGCPYGAKWNARVFVEEAVDKGGTLINGAKVKKVILEKNKAVGVDYVRGKEIHNAMAPLVVVSAGGMGSPDILRQTGIKNVGRDIFFDPLITVIGSVKDIKGGHEFPMATGMHFEEEGYVMTDLTLAPAVYMSLTAGAFRFDRIFSQSRALSIMIKIKDALGGSLTDGGEIKKKLTESDMNMLSKGYKRARDILEKAGAKNIFKTSITAAHPGGTVKIDDIVNRNLETEYENLYVCDCSVIPEAWGLPPVLTLIGLGKRLAKHLCGEKNAGLTQDS